MMISGDHIKKVREAMGMSQQELAKLAKISQAHVAKIENDNVDPRLSTVNKILMVLERRQKRMECRNYMKKPVMVEYNSPLKDVITTMKTSDISQIPVMKKGKLIGSIKESTIIERTHRGFYNIDVGEIMDKPFPVLDYRENVEIVRSLLEFSQAVLITKKGNVVGIITKADLL